jgi:hypothetical protein
MAMRLGVLPRQALARADPRALPPTIDLGKSSYQT